MYESLSIHEPAGRRQRRVVECVSGAPGCVREGGRDPIFYFFIFIYMCVYIYIYPGCVREGRRDPILLFFYFHIYMYIYMYISGMRS